MSLESARAFYSRMVEDEAFRTQLEQASSNEERQQTMHTAGYEFTSEEWRTVMSEIQESNSADSELRDTQLETVSGGGVETVLNSVAAYGSILV